MSETEERRLLVYPLWLFTKLVSVWCPAFQIFKIDFKSCVIYGPLLMDLFIIQTLHKTIINELES